MKILIIYEEVPENTKFYVVEVTAEEWTWMQLAHGHFVNGSYPTPDACNKLSEWLEGLKPILATEPILVRGEGFDYVLHTGFIL